MKLCCFVFCSSTCSRTRGVGGVVVVAAAVVVAVVFRVHRFPRNCGETPKIAKVRQVDYESGHQDWVSTRHRDHASKCEGQYKF